jgi:hypothetical protein
VEEGEQEFIAVLSEFSRNDKCGLLFTNDEVCFYNRHTDRGLKSMSVEAVSGYDSWQQFMRVIEAARARNTSFSPAERTKQSAAQTAVGARRKAQPKQLAAAPLAQRLYTPSVKQPRTLRAALGTRFDAYA